MPETKGPIDFASGQQSSNEPLGGAISSMMNVLVDATGAVHVRPGISAWSGFSASPSYSASTSVDGITVWNEMPVYVTSDRRLHAQPALGYGVDISSATTATQLDGSTRPVFALARDRVVVAGGGLLQKWEGVGAGLSARLGGNPPPATHVANINQLLVVNPRGLSGQIQFSGDATFNLNDESWLALNFRELESDSDPVSAVYANTGELVGFGTRTVQTLDPDPTEAFINIRTWSGGGIAAPYSFAQNDETFGFLDTKKRIQLSNGRSYTPISDPALTATLGNLNIVSDCWGFRAKIDSWDLLGWVCPTAGRTFIYDTGRKQWSEWSGFSAGAFGAWAAKSHYHWDTQDVHLVGLGDGTIGKLDATVTTDNGAPIVAEVISGFQDFGTDLWKTHTSTRLYFRRGLGTFGATRPPRCQLFWRDGTGAWEGPEELDLGAPDDVNPIVEVRGLGVYQMRQWRLRMSDTVPLTLVRAIETFETGEM
jgi:hypothetical protein